MDIKSRALCLFLFALTVGSVSCSSNGEGESKPGSKAESKSENSASAPQSVSTPVQPSPSTADTELTLTSAIDQAIVDAGRALSGDPKAVREYVSRTIRPESYDGVVKGARGAYLTQAGSSADRSLLMAALIRGGGHKSDLRFGSCEGIGPVGARSAADGSAAAGAIDLEAVAAQVDIPDLSAGIRSLGKLLTQARLEANQSATQLTSALGPVLAPIIKSRSANMKGETPHVWPQIEEGGSWVDLDPSTESGSPPCSPTTTSAVLPPQLFHRIVLSVIVENRKSGSLQQSSALRAEYSTADLAASRILFAFGEPTGLVQSLQAAADGTIAYTPVLRIDGQTVKGTPIILPQIGGIGGAQALADANAGVFGGDFFGGSEEATAPPDEVTAAWIEIEMVGPGQSSISARSEIFDRLGMVARQAGSASSATPEPLREVAGEYAAMSSIWEIGLLLGESAASEAIPNLSLNVATADGLSALLDGLIRGFPTVRRDLGGVPAAPIIMLAGLVPTDTPPGAPAVSLILDAVHVPVVPPKDAAAAGGDALATVFAEAVLTADVGESSAHFDDVAGVIRAARSSSIPLRVIKPGDAATVLGASGNALARMASRSKQGFPIVALASAPSAGTGAASTAWWFVDPSTGAVRDEHENGRHDAIVERAVPEQKTASNMERLRSFGCKIAKPMIIASTAVFLLTGGVQGKDALKAMAKTAEAYNKNRERGEKALKIACGDRNVPQIPAP